MRKYNLRQTANQYLKLASQGSYKERKQQAYVIRKMIDDLYTVGDVPPSWNALQSLHIHKLIAYWKRSKLRTGTIMNHMTIVRRYLKSIDCSLTNIDNKSLQLSKSQKRRRKLKLQHDHWKEWDIQIPRLIMALQTEFGLTFQEAIYVKPEIHIQEDSLWITRNISFNSLDRTIPIRNETQETILSEIRQLTQRKAIVEFNGYEETKFAWRKELKKYALPLKKSWRYLYAKQMYQYLLPILGKYETYWLIRSEMGIKSRDSLWRYLNE
ncbi:phage integrase N-terminal domain-containing protein [Legionella gresilensis]|uniref:phage integrase N-terminal domain-containing protein n=1 Tax=Legionella gresilensis TaxID=91823 RepID=UPI001041B389|nr:phage integrase N-terminal domain-containing protein [Legionella gresilensis]